MSQSNPPEGVDPDETSQPAATRPAEPTGAAPPVGGDMAPDAQPASGPADATAGGSSDAGANAPAQADPADEAAPNEPDALRDPILEEIQATLGGAVLGSSVAKSDLLVRVERSAWRATAQHLKEHGFTYFCFLSGIDWMPSAELSNRYEQTFTADAAATDEVEPPPMAAGVGGGDTRFQVFARFYDTERFVGVTVKADLDDAAPSVESISGVFRGADWHEREAWEMFGFDFVGHPGLRHLYLPSEFEGFPLRKDFPLLARVVKPWPGLVDKEPIPGEDEEEEAAAAT